MISLVDASDMGLQFSEDFLIVFDGVYLDILQIIWLVLTVQFIWVGMGMTLGSNYRLQELILKMRRVWLAMLLASMSLGVDDTFPPLHQIGRDIRDSIIYKIAGNYQWNHANVMQEVARVKEEVNKADYTFTPEELDKIKIENDKNLIVDGTVCDPTNCPSLVRIVNNYIQIDTIFTAGFGLAVAAFIVFTIAAVAGGIMSMTALGFGMANLGWGLLGGILPVVMGLMGFGLMMMGWSLAMTLSFFVLDFQLRMLAHLAPLFLLGYAFDATKPYADAWTKALIKNVFGSIFMVLFSLLSVKIINAAGGGAGAFFFGLTLFFAVSRYALQMAADLIGGIASPTEDIASTGQAARASGNQVEQGMGGGSGASAWANDLVSHHRGAFRKDHKLQSEFGQPLLPKGDDSSGSRPVPNKE